MKITRSTNTNTNKAIANNKKLAKNKVFQENDLVLAKMRGYSAWPAKITDVINPGKRYGVYFYGTGETANIKTEQLDHYEKVREKVFSNERLKKQKSDFYKAVEEIEAVLDGDDVDVNRDLKPKTEASSKIKPILSAKISEFTNRSARKIKFERSSYDEEFKMGQNDIKKEESNKINELSDIQCKVVETELEFQTLILEIKMSVALNRTNLLKCLVLMDKVLELDLTAVMLTKNRSCVEAITSMRKYVGNLKEWNLTAEQKLEFEEKAAQVREKALQIFNKFKQLFSVDEEYHFWNYFDAKVAVMSEYTKNMTSYEKFCIVDDPLLITQ